MKYTVQHYLSIYQATGSGVCELSRENMRGELEALRLENPDNLNWREWIPVENKWNLVYYPSTLCHSKEYIVVADSKILTHTNRQDLVLLLKNVKGIYIDKFTKMLNSAKKKDSPFRSILMKVPRYAPILAVFLFSGDLFLWAIHQSKLQWQQDIDYKELSRSNDEFIFMTDISASPYSRRRFNIVISTLKNINALKLQI